MGHFCVFLRPVFNTYKKEHLPGVGAHRAAPLFIQVDSGYKKELIPSFCWQHMSNLEEASGCSFTTSGVKEAMFFHSKARKNPLLSEACVASVVLPEYYSVLVSKMPTNKKK